MFNKKEHCIDPAAKNSFGFIPRKYCKQGTVECVSTLKSTHYYPEIKVEFKPASLY